MSELRWSRDYMESLATHNPELLIDAMLNGTIPVYSLTFAAECLGFAESPRVIPTLLDLSRHPAAVVREGAVYGLLSFTESEEVRKRLEEMHRTDVSPGIRSVTGDGS